MPGAGRPHVCSPVAKRPARAWAARDTEYVKHEATLQQGLERDGAPPLPSDAAGAIGAADTVGAAGPAGVASAARAAGTRGGLRWRATEAVHTAGLPHSSRIASGGRILSALQELQNTPHVLDAPRGRGAPTAAHAAGAPTAEALTEGGVTISQMKLALAVEPRLCAPTIASVAAEMEHAITKANERPAPRPRLPVSARLEKLEQGLQRDLATGLSATERITRLLRRHQKKLLAKFAEWDLDGNGKISRAELQHVMEQVGLFMQPNDLDEFFAEFDPDHSGSLDVTEFYGVAYSGGTRRRPWYQEV